MKININFNSNGNFLKKIVLFVLFGIAIFLIHSCNVQAFSLEQVPSFLNDYSNYDIVCKSGKTNNNGDPELNCDFLGENPISSWQDVNGGSILFPGYLTHWTLLKRYVTLIKTPGNGNGNITLIFTSLPLSVSCHSSNSSIPFICELGTYRNNTFNKYNEFSTTRVLTSFVGLKNGSTSYGFDVVEEPGAYGSLWSDSYSNSNYYYNNVNVKDFIFANYDLYFLHDNSTVYSNYDFVNWSSFEEFVDSDNRNWFQKIVDGIVNIPNVISKWGRELVNVGDFILDGLKDLFIPSSDFLNNKFNQLYNSTAQQFGFLFYPFDFIISILTRFVSIQDTQNYIISWPDFNVPNFDFVLIPAGSFDFNSILSHPSINLMHEYYLIIVDAMCIIAFINLCIDEYHTIFGGTVVTTYESLTETDTTTLDNNGKVLTSKHTDSSTRGRKESKKK